MSVIELSKESAGTFTLTVTDASGPVDLTGVEIRFYLKRKGNMDKPDEAVHVLRKATVNVSGGSDNQIRVIDAAKGIAEIRFVPADTENLEVLSYAYRYRVHVKPSGSNNYIVLSDKFRLKG